MTADQITRFFVVGANHRSSSAMLRDRLFVDEARLPEFFARLSEAGIAQAVVLSTCDRVEVQAANGSPEDAAEAIRDLFVALSGLAADEVRDQLYAHFDDDAVRHAFAVASSLDSQVIGEPQVLGQVKEGHREARGHGMVGAELERVLQAAYTAAKRVRTESAIAERPVSIASAAAQVARDVHGDLQRATALVIGLGEIGDLICQQLRVAGLGRLTLAGPSRRTEAEARRLGCHFAPFEEVETELGNADIVVTAAGTGRYVVTAEGLSDALVHRRRRPILVLDGGVPADVDPAADALDGVFRYTLDDLERVVMEGRAQREASAAEAWRIVDDEVAAWHKGRAERHAVPSVVALRSRFEALRDEVLASNPGAGPEDATRLLVNRLLHEPSQALRGIAAGNEVAGMEDLVRRLFGLDGREDEDETQ
jgi:glutamyl-tRNA reductase